MPECQKFKMVGYTSMVLNPSNSSNSEQLALKGLIRLGSRVDLRQSASNDLSLSVGSNVIMQVKSRAVSGLRSRPHVSEVAGGCFHRIHCLKQIPLKGYRLQPLLSLCSH